MATVTHWRDFDSVRRSNSARVVMRPTACEKLNDILARRFRLDGCVHRISQCACMPVHISEKGAVVVSVLEWSLKGDGVTSLRHDETVAFGTKLSAVPLVSCPWLSASGSSSEGMGWARFGSCGVNNCKVKIIRASIRYCGSGLIHHFDNVPLYIWQQYEGAKIVVLVG